MTRPLPEDALVDDLDRPFWDAANRGELLVHRCSVCGRCYWPAGSCVEHGGDAMQWVPASGRGVVHTFTIFRRRYHPAFDPPYCVAVIKLEEGPFFHSRVLGEVDNVHVGQQVHVEFREIRRNVRLPMFRPTTTEHDDQE